LLGQLSLFFVVFVLFSFSPARAQSIASITVTPGATSIAPTQTQQFTATALDSGGNPVSTSFVWSSSNPAICSVDPTTGLATGVAAGGPVAITAAAGGVVSNSANCTVVATPQRDANAFGLSAQVGGTNLFVTDTVFNGGNVKLDTVLVNFYLSLTGAGNDFLIATRTITDLQPLATSTVTQTLSIPGFGVPVGTYFIKMVVDPNNQIAEINEGNNVRVANQFAIGPDLRVLALNVSFANGQFFITDTVQNIGNDNTGSFKVGLYLSLNTTFEAANDFKLVPGERSVSGLAGGSAVNTGSGTHTPATSTPPGTYAVIAYADPATPTLPRGDVIELNENNNTQAIGSFALTRDLVAFALSGSVTSVAEGELTASYTIRNTGNMPATNVLVKFYLSNDNNNSITPGDLILHDQTDLSQECTRTIPTIPGAIIPSLPGASSASIVCSTAGFTPGVYTLKMIVDPDDTIPEGNETNNVRADGALTIQNIPPKLNYSQEAEYAQVNRTLPAFTTFPAGAQYPVLGVFPSCVAIDPLPGTVNPRCTSVASTNGVANIDFTYKLIYTDKDSTPPAFVRVLIEGTPHDMQVDTGATDPLLRDGSVRNGEQYVFIQTVSVNKNSGPFNHTYQFTASDSFDTTNFPSSTVNRPVVSANAPILSNAVVTPVTTDTFRFQIDYLDPDGNPPSSVKINIDLTGNGTECPLNPTDCQWVDLMMFKDPTEGSITYTMGSKDPTTGVIEPIHLPPGNLAYYFSASDGVIISYFTNTLLTAKPSTPPTLTVTAAESSNTLIFHPFGSSGAGWTFIGQPGDTALDTNDGDKSFLRSAPGPVGLLNTLFDSPSPPRFDAITAVQVWAEIRDEYHQTEFQFVGALASDGVTPLSFFTSGGDEYGTFIGGRFTTNPFTGGPWTFGTLQAQLQKLTTENALAVTEMFVTVEYTIEPEFRLFPERGYGADSPSDGVNPNTGTTVTQFIFKINYFDELNRAPTAVNVVIDGTSYPMRHSTEGDPGCRLEGDLTFLDGDYSNGEEYCSDGISLGIGSRSYSFFAATAGASTDRVRLDFDTVKTTFTGPIVTGSTGGPTLSFSQESGYVTDGINPDSGDPATSFTYKVVYTGSVAPGSILVHIDGDAGHLMSLDAAAAAPLHDGVYTNGEQYFYQTLLAPPVGSPHSYTFEARDAGNQSTAVTLPVVGPTVSSPTSTSNLSLSATIGVSPDTGDSLTLFTYSVEYRDSSGNPPAFVRVHIDGDPPAQMTPAISIGPNTDFANGVTYLFTRNDLTPGTHTYFFEASNGASTISLPVRQGPIVAEDPAPSLTITDLRAGILADSSSMIITWTSPAGTPCPTCGYVIKYSANQKADTSWDTIQPIPDPLEGTVSVGPAQPPGRPESHVLSGLISNAAYSIGIRFRDASGTLGPISNVINPSTALSTPVTPLLVGENMISVPLSAQPNDPFSLFGDDVQNFQLYRYQGGTFESPTLVTPGTGYILNSPTIGVIDAKNITRTPTPSPFTLSLQSAWNLIGNPYDRNVSLASVQVHRIGGPTLSYADAVAAGWVSNAIYLWNGDGYDAQPFDSAILRPWKGYWLEVLDNTQSYELVIP
jgi:hypothetical protein